MNNIEWRDGTLILLDQTKLPTHVEYLQCTDWRQVAEAIKMLRVRGAPAIGVAAGYGLILAAVEANRLAVPFSEQLSTFYEWSEELKETRPTAINLAWAVNRIIAIVKAGPFASMHEIIDRITHEAIVIHEEDVQLNTRMAINGATVFKGKQNLRILTHCNAGALATGGLGTALGVIRKLHEQGQLAMVYADETRPLLQGARLTAFELHEDGIPVTLETDNMAAYAMQQGLIDAIIVGADRITTEG
ncbi:MAG: S-methyl-5-thioribose-1-phosphate isomerase, partial [Veillonella sp.]|nr:S-methyl-5-thioribose-1-phosphate isomerase [Veillonella sp.]